MNTKQKLSKLVMATLAFTLTILIGLNGFAQSKKELRAQKKEKENQEQEVKYNKAKAAMFDTAFVITVESIQFRNHGVTNVTQNINFVQVIGKDGVLQIGSDLAPGPGLNNLGGFTLKGPISNIKIKEKKNKVYMSYVLTGLIGTARIAISIVGSNQATVDVDGMYSGRAFTMRGDLKTLKEAQVFEGTEF
nr:DUF4251 domain-containing protein [Bacteroidota bacterium]